MNKRDPLKNIRVVLAHPSHPGNIGAAARAMKTMGLDALHLVRPRRFPDPEADARAAGAEDLLRNARMHPDIPDALRGCAFSVATSSRHRELRHDLMDARAAARELVAQAAHHPAAIVFGNETTGLTSEEAGLCRVWARIPSDPRYPSLNLAAAVQIFAYELRLATAQPAPPAEPEFVPANFEQLDLLYRHFEKTMTHSGFFDPANPKRLLPRLRRLLARARLETGEVDILRGFLNAVDKMHR
ncbi:MAG TPA: RNA methyltransferase [Burkholderiales bacterium]|nr:RNA methyltransferase [Burkholderiales bacterium]